MTKMILDTSRDWVSSCYNEDTLEETNYYINVRHCEKGDKAYLYSVFNEELTEMEIVKIIHRAGSDEYYDCLMADALLDSESCCNADTSAEFIMEDDCCLVWFKYC